MTRKPLPFAFAFLYLHFFAQVRATKDTESFYSDANGKSFILDDIIDTR